VESQTNSTAGGIGQKSFKLGFPETTFLPLSGNLGAVE
jgi:hypothetical protein